MWFQHAHLHSGPGSLDTGLFSRRSKHVMMVLWWTTECDWQTGWMGKCSQGRGLEEGLNGDWNRVRGLNLTNGSAGVELILFALELSGLRIRELCLYARHLLSIMMSHSRPYHVPWWGWMSWPTGYCSEWRICLMGQNHFIVLSIYCQLSYFTVYSGPKWSHNATYSIM